jgi:hypothetical protein
MLRISFVAALLACSALAQSRPFNFATTNSPAAPFASGGYGDNITGMGDVDDDGFEDYAVVAPGAAMPLGGLDPFGVIYVHSGRDGALLVSMLGDQLGADLGKAMVSLGDVSGDGVPDLCVGSPSHDFAFGNAGRVTMYSGADGSVLWSSDGDAQGLERGTCLAAMPDITGDGVPDVLAGEPGYSVGGLGRGRAVFLNGATGATAGEAIGPLALSSFGTTSVGSTSQLAVFVGDAVGRVYMVPAPVAGLAAPTLFRDKPPGSHVAANLALVPKVSGGLRVAIALTSADVNGNNSGALWLHELGGFELFEHAGAVPIASLGASVARCHDLDGDGEDEVMVTRGNGGALPAVVEVLRQDGSIQETITTTCAGAPTLWSIHDTTGDGRGELMMAYASGLCGLAEAWLFATGLEVGAASSPAGVTASSTIDFGAARAGQDYWQLFSITGTEPGFVGAGWPLVPLNIDGITTLADSLSGTPVAPDTAGVLDAAGRATTTLNVPASIAPFLSGLPFQTVAVVLDGTGLEIVATTNPAGWVMP